MRRVFIVPEAGYGTSMVALATEMGPGVEPVVVVPEAGYGAEAVFVAFESGRGIPLVFPVEGQQFLPPHLRVASAPVVVEPDVNLLAPADHAVLGQLAGLWDALQATNGQDPAALRTMLDAAIAAVNHPWPEPIWSEDVMHKACVSAIGLFNVDPAQVAKELELLCGVILERRWLQGGPGGYFEASTSQETLRVLPIAQKAAAASAVAAVSVTPAQWSADPAGRHELRWWDGGAWTEHISDRGQVGIDPIT